MVKCYGSRSQAQTLGHIDRDQWLLQRGALLGRNVSGTIHTDLIGSYPWQDSMTGHLVDFKPHCLVDLSGNYSDSFAESHTRKISRRDGQLSISRVEPTGPVRLVSSEPGACRPAPVKRNGPLLSLCPDSST